MQPDPVGTVTLRPTCRAVSVQCVLSASEVRVLFVPQVLQRILDKHRPPQPPRPPDLPPQHRQKRSSGDQAPSAVPPRPARLCSQSPLGTSLPAFQGGLRHFNSSHQIPGSPYTHRAYEAQRGKAMMPPTPPQALVRETPKG